MESAYRYQTSRLIVDHQPWLLGGQEARAAHILGVVTLIIELFHNTLLALSWEQGQWF